MNLHITAGILSTNITLYKITGGVLQDLMVYAATVPGPVINQHVCPSVLSSGLPAPASLLHGFTSHYLYSVLPRKQHSELLSAHCHSIQNMHVSLVSIPLCVWSTLLVMNITLESFSCGKKLTGPYSGAQHGCI